MEIWKSITGYEGLYEISNFGRVNGCRKSLGRYDNEYDAHLAYQAALNKIGG